MQEVSFHACSERTTCKFYRRSMAEAESGRLRMGTAEARGMGPTAHQAWSERFAGAGCHQVRRGKRRTTSQLCIDVFPAILYPRSCAHDCASSPQGDSDCDSVSEPANGDQCICCCNNFRRADLRMYACHNIVLHDREFPSRQC